MELRVLSIRSGSPQTDKAAFRATVLPAPLPPHRWRKKGWYPVKATRGAAKLAASAARRMGDLYRHAISRRQAAGSPSGPMAP